IACPRLHLGKPGAGSIATAGPAWTDAVLRRSEIPDVERSAIARRASITFDPVRFRRSWPHSTGGRASWYRLASSGTSLPRLHAFRAMATRNRHNKKGQAKDRERRL